MSIKSVKTDSTVIMLSMDNVSNIKWLFRNFFSNRSSMFVIYDFWFQSALMFRNCFQSLFPIHLKIDSGSAKNNIVSPITLSNEFKVKKKMEYDFLYIENTTDRFLFMVAQEFISLYNWIICKYFSSKWIDYLNFSVFTMVPQWEMSLEITLLR